MTKIWDFKISYSDRLVLSLPGCVSVHQVSGRGFGVCDDVQEVSRCYSFQLDGRHVRISCEGESQATVFYHGHLTEIWLLMGILKL